MARGETMPVVDQLVIFKIGEGNIDPEQRILDGEIDQNVLAEAAERLKNGEFYAKIDPKSIPTKCVDGRSRLDGLQELGANSAGGTLSVVMADALTTNRFRDSHEKAPEHARRVYRHLGEKGYKIGGHDADHAGEDGCGCGAEDALDAASEAKPSIIRYMARRGDDIREFLSGYDVEIDDATHRLLVNNATRLYQEGYATNGKELRSAMIAEAGESSVETLTGKHLEGILSINTKAGTTFDRQAFAAAFDGKIEAFNVDIWALQNAAQVTSVNDKEASQKFAAMLYYNVATAAVLSKNIAVIAR
jgi:hypothetical protein